MATVNLSYSSLTVYNFCSEKYRLQKIERIPEGVYGSSLLFGSAIDAALNRVLLLKKPLLNAEEQATLGKTAMECFEEKFAQFNGVVAYETEAIAFTTKDCEIHVLNEQDLTNVYKYAKQQGLKISSIVQLHELVDELKSFRKDRKTIDTPTLFVYNYLAWTCLKKKAALLIETYEKEIMPQIEEVKEIQVPIELLNDFGDRVPGFADAVVRFVGDKEYSVIDNKTSSKPYTENSVKESLQLAIYCEKLGFKNAAYIVLDKSIRKNYPYTRFQIIKDQFNEDDLDRHFNTIELGLKKIKAQEFHKKESSKECYQYGQKCPYADICWGKKEE